MSDRKYQLVVFGATSFVGQILMRYLFERHGVDGELRWAIAGRSDAKLVEVRKTLGPAGQNLPLIIADADNEAALRGLCDSAKVVVSTVGPYALFGSQLVRICAETGTDYCDLTGEVQWIRRMIGLHEQTAKASGARIVHCCGFDSIPSDLGVHFLQRAARERLGQPCSRVKLRIRAMKGGFSGGTVASLMNVLVEAMRDPVLRRALGNPYALCADDGRGKPRQSEVRFATYDEQARSWLAPFVMSAINTRIVHRSNALSADAYGHDFRYDEAMMTGAGLRGRATAVAVSAALGGFVAAAAVKPTRWLLERVVPQPGEGPSPDAQARGFYDFRFYGTTADGQAIRTKVTGDRDPGYGSTAKMLGEAAACLAFDIDPQTPGGFWTPATLLGDRLIDRLVAHAGLKFEVLG